MTALTYLGGDFATRDIDATFLTRIAEVPVRLGWAVYIDWPGDPIYAIMGHRDITIDAQLWTAVDPATAMVEFSGTAREGRAQRCTVGMRGLAFRDAANAVEEAATVGRKANVYLAAYDKSFTSAVLHQRFDGWVEKPLMINQSETDNGILVDLTMELTDGVNPRRRMARYHAVGTETPGDTAPELLPTVRKDPPWPA